VHQKAGPAVKKGNPAKICKTSIPGSNPGGASKIRANSTISRFVPREAFTQVFSNVLEFGDLGDTPIT
jgi:hypothetical protein